LVECDREISALKNQMSNFMSELNHLKSLEQRYKDENGDLQRRIDHEGCQNVELSGAIKELEAIAIAEKPPLLIKQRSDNFAPFNQSNMTEL